MSESKKAVLVVIFIVALVGAGLAWGAPERPGTPENWAWRIGLSLLAIACLALLLWGFGRRGLVPDFLHQARGRMFERGGVCFKVGGETMNGTAYVTVAFENRYASPCEFRVAVSAPPKFFSTGTEHFPGVDVVVQCAGGMLGLIRAPIGIPKRFQGRKIKFRLAAQTKYLGKLGDLLRFRGGTAVGDPGSSRLTPALFSLAALLTGHIHLHVKRDAIAPLVFPPPVAEDVTGDAEPTVEILWESGDPEDGVVERLTQVMGRR